MIILVFPLLPFICSSDFVSISVILTSKTVGNTVVGVVMDIFFNTVGSLQMEGIAEYVMVVLEVFCIELCNVKIPDSIE